MKKQLVTLSIIVLILVTALVIANALGNRAVTADSESSGDQYEYLVVAGGQTNLTATSNTSLRKETTGSFSRELFPLEQNLDKLGAKGWELVTVLGNPADPVYYFKRRK